MRKYFISAITVCILLLLTGYQLQAINTDSLKQVLKQSNGNEKIDIQNKLSWNIKFNDPVRAKELSTKALFAASKADYKKGIMIANRNLAAIGFLQGKPDTCMHYAQIALDFAKELNDTFQQGKIYNLLGISYRKKHGITKALEYHNKAIQKFRLLNDSSEIVGNMHNKAVLFELINDYVSAYKIYQQVLEFEIREENAAGISRTAIHLGSIAEKNQDYFNAIRYYKMGMKYAREIKNKRWYSAGLHDIANVYFNLDSVEKAEKFYNKALVINSENQFQAYKANNLYSLGNLYFDKDFGKAEQYFLEALKIYKQSGLINDYAQNMLTLSSLYRVNDRIEVAGELANNALIIADSLQQPDLLSSAYYELYHLSKNKKRYKSALDYLEKFKYYQDSLDAVKNDELLSTLQARYDFKKMEKENQSLKHKNKLQRIKNGQQKIYLIVTVIIIILVLLLVVVMFLSFRKIKKLNKQLEQHQKKIQKQTRELENSLVTKDKFFSIVAHDLKNPFMGIMGFSDLLLRQVDKAENEELKTYAESIYRSAAELYELLENLLNWSKSQRGDFKLYIKENVSLYQETQKSIEQLSWNAREKNIHLENNINENLLVNTDINILQTVIRNLLSNAIKYSQKDSEINIGAYTRQDNVIYFVRDHGTGMTEDIKQSIFKVGYQKPKKGTARENGTGLGLVLSKELLEMQGDELWFESEEGKGSTFYFSVKLS